jgi:hypothetical protein
MKEVGLEKKEAIQQTAGYVNQPGKRTLNGYFSRARE